MTFLTPLFLVGLAALAVPVLIHLIQRERKTVIPFPSLMFLRRIPYQSVRRRRIRHWALLALRLLALALIVAAFARPFMRGTDAAAMSGGARDVVVVLDRSYSMGYMDTWTRAQAAARQAIEQLQPSDRASLVLFASEAEVVARASADPSQLLSAIDTAEPVAGATRYGAALKLAGSLLAESTLPRREVVLISDFQRAGWEPGQALRLPSGTTVTPVSVRAPEITNLAVTPVTVQRETFSGRERVVVSAGVINRGDRAVRDLAVNLEIDGKVVESVRVSADAHGAASLTFPAVTLDARNTRGAVRIPDDGLSRDNVVHFVLSPAEPLAVTLLASAGAARDDVLYLTRALAIGDRPRFEVAARTGDDVPAEALARTRVLIVNDTSVSPGAAGRFARFVEAGGGLLVALGPRSVWPERETAMLPGTIGQSVDRMRGTAATLTGLEYGHAVFEPFRAPRSGDFSSARFYGYRAFTPAPDAEVLARFDDGVAALVERRVGAGRVMVWTSTLDLAWSDLPLKPVYLPFVHRVVRHLAAYRERPTSLTVGQVLELASNPGKDERVALAPSGQRLPIPSNQPGVLQLTEQGFYEIRGENASGGPVEVVASNVDLAESDLTPIDPQEIATAVSGGRDGATPEKAAVPSDEAQEREQRIWWYLLFAGILLLTTETWLAHRLSRAA
jgi:hypothetical protein